GAYGQEVSETVIFVRALDTSTGRIMTFENRECRFGYRDSLFRSDEPGRYVILSVGYRLRPRGPATIRYADAEKDMAARSHRKPAGPRGRAGRALDETRARDRRARRREGARRRRLCPPGTDRRRGALRRPAHPRARLLGRGRAMSAMRILVVEDDERLAEIFRDFIAELGYQPTVVGSAEAAVEALTSARPDTILLDVRLPGMSGVEFLNLPVV